MFHHRELHDAQSLSLALGETPAMIERICARLAEEGLLFTIDGQYGLVIEDAKKITVSRVARAFAQPIHGEVGGSTVIWQELSDAFMKVGDSVNLASSTEDVTDVRELFDSSGNGKRSTGPLPATTPVEDPASQLVQPTERTEEGDTTPHGERDPGEKEASEKASPKTRGSLDLKSLFGPGRSKPRT
jgi:DNA-binding IscR family transcriptional regulator